MSRKNLALGLLFFLTLGLPLRAQAAGWQIDPPPGPDRVRWVEETYWVYTWWLVGWEDDTVVCEIRLTAPGPPDGNTIYDECGPAAYQRWVQTAPCTEADKSACAGYYLFLAREEAHTRLVTRPLPAARIWLSLGRCLPQGLGVWCPQSPALTLAGEEPLAGHAVVEIAGELDGAPFSCRGDVCTLPLPPTGVHHLTVWGLSSYGDSTTVQEMYVEVRPLEEGWQLSLVSADRQPWPQPFCAEYWQAFPPLPDELPPWLQPLSAPDDLHTAYPLSFLAGRLLTNNLAEAASCLQNGVGDDGWATDCGLRSALPQVVAWQNRFNETLFQVGEQYQVPPLLLKNLFAYESQLWPGAGAAGHAGFGQLTLGGADLALMWNPRLYEQFCPQVYAVDLCRQGYWSLNDVQRQFLQEAFYARMDAACSGCPNGVNVPQAEESIAWFAETLRASCAQTGAIITNFTGKPPGEILSYIDLWKLTLANYHAGAGCLGDALQAAQGELSWETLADAFPSGCRSAVPYVEAVISGP